MPELSLLSDADLLTRMPALVLAERAAAADVLERCWWRRPSSGPGAVLPAQSVCPSWDGNFAATAGRAAIGGACSFVDAEGRRCKERRFLTLEHDQPFALSGQPTVENISILCSAHNAHLARTVFGEAFVAEKRALRELSSQPKEQEASPQPDNFAKVQSALMKLGFRRQDASQAMNQLRQTQADAGLEPFLRAALRLLTPCRS